MTAAKISDVVERILGIVPILGSASVEDRRRVYQPAQPTTIDAYDGRRAKLRTRPHP